MGHRCGWSCGSHEREGRACASQGRGELAEALSPGSVAKFTDIFQEQEAPKDAWQLSLKDITLLHDSAPNTTGYSVT